MKDHIVVVGYSHLGSRLIEHCKAAGLAYCLIEKDRGAVDDLLRAGTPVVVDDARELGTLSDAGVAHAKMVIIASNNLETALMVTKRARQLNKLCQIVVRCFHDDFEDILESLGANEIISSSKNAFCDILKRCTL